MPTTPVLLLPYPNESDPADVPADVQKLAVQIEAVRGAANGLASLDSTTKIPAAQLPSGVYVPTSAIGQANGVASLDATGKVPVAQLPAATGGAPPATAFPGSPADGQLCALKAGNDVIVFVYNAALAKWISAPVVAGSPTAQQATSGMNWVGLNSDMRFRWAELAAAAVKVQARGLVEGVDTQNDQNGCQGRFVRYSNSVPAIANGVAVAQTNFGAMSYLAHQSGMIDWTDLAIPAANFAAVQLQGSTQDSNGHSGGFWGTLWLRFTS